MHVHVECKHGFALVSGMRDDTLQPACHRDKCKEDGEKWLRSEGLLSEKSCTIAEEDKSEKAADGETDAPILGAGRAIPGTPISGTKARRKEAQCDQQAQPEQEEGATGGRGSGGEAPPVSAGCAEASGSSSDMP